MAASVWGGPEKNFWVSGFMKVMAGHIDIPKPPPDAPGMFRCADAEMMKEMLRKAGFKNVTARDYVQTAQADSIDMYWTYMNEMAAPVVAAMRDADQPTRQKIKTGVYEAIRRQYATTEPLRLEYHAVVLTGEK
jgi:hypothetical protein